MQTTHHRRVLGVGLIPLAECEELVVEDGRPAPLVDPAHQLPALAALVLDRRAEGGPARQGGIPVVCPAIGTG